MKQLFFLLLVSVAAFHEEEKEEKRFIYPLLGLSKELGELVELLYEKPMPCPSDKCSQLTSYCDSFGNKTFCGCRPPGTECSKHIQCCSNFCPHKKCRCRGRLICKLERKNGDCCHKLKCLKSLEPRARALTAVGYGVCQEIRPKQ